MTGDIKNRVPEPVLVSLEDELEIDDRLIRYCLLQSEQTRLRCRVLEDYYNNKTAVQRRRMEDGDKPNNRISHAFARYITKIATAYFMGHGVRYEVKNRKYKSELDTLLGANMTAVKHFEEAKCMSKCGVAFELLYINTEGRLCTQAFGAGEIIPVFSNSLGSFLSLALRPYEINPLGGTGQREQYVEVYTKREVVLFCRTRGSCWKELKRREHHFSDVPVIVRMNNDELRGDYEDVIPQIDGYDKAQSDTANDLDYFSDAYLAVEGATGLVGEGDDGEELSRNEAVSVLKRERILFVPEKGKVYFVTKDTSDTISENHKKRLYKDIFFISQVANLTDEAFAGNLSGVAIKYKLFGLEELSIEKEAYFTSSEKKKLRLMTEYINTLRGTDYDWREVELSFDRSSIANEYEAAQIMQLLQGILSDETLIGKFPGIKDAAAEMQQRQRERENAENLGLIADGEVF